MHKIYSAFLRGDTSLIDGFKDSNPQLFDKLLDLWMILSKNHKYFSTPKTTKSEKEEAAKVSASFTKKFLFMEYVGPNQILCSQKWL